ncbi:MAG TPA: glycine betaine ABC transporter substrate-binding protein [Symbiobacteriaceae bacterium]|nr:glycine betaine ABC transporter substrate-binding protein [Symbiobacteriaceae bacterium]
MRFMRKYRALVAVAALFLLAVIAGCGGNKGVTSSGENSGGATGTAKKEVIKLADVQWQSLWINNAIAQFILEKGYGYPTETVEMTTPIMQQSLVKGDVDLSMEMWRSNIIDWYTDAVQTDKIIDLGTTFERASQGWYVPRYMVEGDTRRGLQPVAPDLKSIADLKKYKHLLKDPENPDKGLLISCITGWQCAKVNEIKLHAYGLGNDYNLMEPGASAALDAAIAGAYKKGDPFLAYYWEPTWLVGTYDLIQLEEPPYSKECDAEIQKFVKIEKPDYSQVKPVAGCGYQTEAVTKVIAPSLAKRAPEVVEVLKKMDIGTDPLNKASAYMESNKVKADKAALWFFENYPDRWKAWLPADVQEKVIKALQEAGVKL